MNLFMLAASILYLGGAIVYFYNKQYGLGGMTVCYMFANLIMAVMGK